MKRLLICSLAVMALGVLGKGRPPEVLWADGLKNPNRVHALLHGDAGTRDEKPLIAQAR